VEVLVVSPSPTRCHRLVLIQHVKVASGLIIEDIKAQGLRGSAFSISQCTTFGAVAGNCTSSKFQIEDISFLSIHGTTTTSQVASFQCSAVKPCKNIAISDVSLRLSNGTVAREYLCGEVRDIYGFSCTGPVCVGATETGGC
jgi:hypothetical protein